MHAYEYDNLGRFLHDKVLTFASNVDTLVQKISTGYNVIGNVESVTSYAANGNVINQVKYEYGNNQKLARLYQSHSGAVNIFAMPCVQYAYDDVNQIKSLQRSDLSESWNYDATGNWAQYNRNGVMENRSHNAANEADVCTHDRNGNMTLMPNLKGKYDAWNRLVEVRDSANSLIARYDYNGLNQRIQKVKDNVVTHSYFNEQWQELETIESPRSPNGTRSAYVWGLRYIDDLIYRQRGAEKLYSLADPNWNVVAITDSTGTVQERLRYNAFGKVEGLTSDWNRTFTGQVFDSDTGLMLYRNRYYHTELGRFVTRDPIGYEAGDVGLYRYVRNMPSVRVDSYGLQVEVEYCLGFYGEYPCNNIIPLPKQSWAQPVHCSNDPCIKACNGNRIPGQLKKDKCIEECFRMEAAFQQWYADNQNITWTTLLPPCPCNLKERCGDTWTEPDTNLHGYHKGATRCIRSTSGGSFSSANQCCYDANDDLITSGSGQGSADKWKGPSITIGFHLMYDADPADWATLLDGGKWGCHSEAYLNVRPQVKKPDCKGVATPT